jgi:extradiol dioxygenase family protein
MTQIPRFHLAIPVDDLAAATRFYGDVLACERGRSHQLVTHLAPAAPRAANPVDGHDVPVPHFGLLLTVPEFHALAERLRTADTAFVIEPYLRFAGQPGEQWTMFLTDPAGNALEFKAFAEDADVFATSA